MSILKQTKKNYDKSSMAESGDEVAVVGLRRSGSSGDITGKCVSCSLKNDNMGLRVTASGNSRLSIPDEELEDEEQEGEETGTSYEDEPINQTPEQQMLNHHLTSTSYHQNHSAPEQLSPPKNQASSTSLLMPNDFVSL